MLEELIKKGESDTLEFKINPLILNRWSPRSMSGDEELSDEELMPF